MELEGQAVRAADLAEAFWVQAADTDVHTLASGSPQLRRSAMDWGVFHVKPLLLDVWRRCRRALQQRNAALQDRVSPAELAAWTHEFVLQAEALDRLRTEYCAALMPLFRTLSGELLGLSADLHYQRGWAADTELAALLAQNLDSDRERGVTSAGPQRADLRLTLDERTARNFSSRGQQKSLGMALILAQARLVFEVTGRIAALVVDEPAADLDREHLARLVGALEVTPAQLFVAAIEPAELPFQGPKHVFHVEHGRVKPLI
jgi:DNA replication and repair protein RecF